MYCRALGRKCIQALQVQLSDAWAAENTAVIIQSEVFVLVTSQVGSSAKKDLSRQPACLSV